MSHFYWKHYIGVISINLHAKSYSYTCETEIITVSSQYKNIFSGLCFYCIFPYHCPELWIYNKLRQYKLQLTPCLEIFHFYITLSIICYLIKIKNIYQRMSLEFDCDQLFEYFKTNCGTQLALSHQCPPTVIQSQQYSGQPSEDVTIENYFSFSQIQPMQNNHIWFDRDLEHPSEKDLYSRKQTFATEEELNECHGFPEKTQNIERITKNQTKNIPKNFGKAIMAFIQKHKKHTKEVLQRTKQGTYKDFLQSINKRRKQINTIADLRQMWVQHPFCSCLRILSHQFLRRHSLRYIFNSRINSYGSHIKYRQRILEAIKKPNQFQHIKDY